VAQRPDLAKPFRPEIFSADAKSRHSLGKFVKKQPQHNLASMMLDDLGESG